MCTINVVSAIGFASDQDPGLIGTLVIVGTAEECAAIQVELSLGDAGPFTQQPAVVQAPGQGAFGVVPGPGQVVWTLELAAAGYSEIKDRPCGLQTSLPTLRVLANCEGGDCKGELEVGEILCREEGECPVPELFLDGVSDCAGSERTAGFSLAVAPFSAGVGVSLDFGDGSQPVTPNLSPITAGGIQIGIGSAAHPYAAPAAGGPAIYTAALSLTNPAGCATAVAPLEVEVAVAACPQPSCPERIELRIRNDDGIDVTADVVDGTCVPAGTYSIRAVVTPPGAADQIAWSLDGGPATAGVLPVVAIGGDTLTYQHEADHAISAVAVNGTRVCGADTLDICLERDERPCPRLEIEIREIGDCDRSGMRLVTFRVRIFEMTGAETIRVDYGDGSSEDSFDVALPANVIGQRQFEHAYAPGAYAVSVGIAGRRCRAADLDLRLDPCEETRCAALVGLTSTPCLPRGGGATTTTGVALAATGNNLEQAEDFTWSFGDGSPPQTTPAPTINHTYSGQGPFSASVTMVRPRRCGPPRTQSAAATIAQCLVPCYCLIPQIAFAFLFLAFLSLMPIIACVQDPATAQWLIVVLIVVSALMIMALAWWLLDPLCRPTRCQLLRILFWTFSWALVIVGILAIGTLCVSALPFGLAYVVAQQLVLLGITGGGCSPGAPSIFSWPFSACR